MLIIGHMSSYLICCLSILGKVDCFFLCIPQMVSLSSNVAIFKKTTKVNKL